MTKRKVYAKPCIAVEDFVLNQFIAGPCQVSVRKVKFSDVPLYKDMLGAGYFAAGVQPNCALYRKRLTTTRGSKNRQVPIIGPAG